MTDYVSEPGKLSRGDMVDEYKECNNNMRHFSNMRFAQTSLFLIMNAFLFNGAFNKNHSGVLDVKLFGLIGISLSILFILMQERRFKLWKKTFDRAVELEADLGFKQHKERPESNFFSTSRGVTDVLYALFGLIWIGTLFV